MGIIYAVGIGPGNLSECSPRALDVLDRCDVIVGYDTYVDLLRSRFPHKATETSGMMKEVDRCIKALELARQGKIVALVSSGDAGVYGMAGLMMELAADDDVTVEVVPGITAACSAAACLGAPLGHDFAVISLSDLLTPWELIERRLRAAAEGDFIVCLYNPASRRRRYHLARACATLMTHRSPDTPAGWVRNIGRDGEKRCVTTLGELAQAELDMFTTVIVGNSCTRFVKGQIVTPRGYRGVSS